MELVPLPAPCSHGSFSILCACGCITTWTRRPRSACDPLRAWPTWSSHNAGVSSVFAESVGRHERLFSKMPPTKVAQFAERVPIIKGRLDAKASTATDYVWFVWEKPLRRFTEFVYRLVEKLSNEVTITTRLHHCASEGEAEKLHWLAVRRSA